jgi:hypothetical protein
LYLSENSDLCHLQHKLIGSYNRDEKCLQRGTNWVFKYNSMPFVFKGLIQHSVVRVEFCRGLHGMFKGGTQLGICFIASELVHYVGLGCGIAGDAGERGAEERVWG